MYYYSLYSKVNVHASPQSTVSSPAASAPTPSPDARAAFSFSDAPAFALGGRRTAREAPTPQTDD